MASKKSNMESVDIYPSTQKRIIIMVALYLAIFLINLDQNIISTAIPRMTDEFHSLDDIGWYGTAYLLTACSFQLLMGKVYKVYPTKPVFLTGILLFEIGSTICGAAPSSVVFIIGRAIAGLGASGLMSGGMVIMVHTIPLQQRPIYQGMFGAVFALGSIVGPLLGGTFTDKLTWRWCFYINLPVGAVSIIVAVLVLRLPNQRLDDRAAGWMGTLKQLDPIGNLVFLPGIVCLVLALQWGGTEYAWANARIIVLLVLCGVLCLIFMGIQYWKQDEATVPPRLVKQRSVAAATWFSFFNGSGLTVLLYYLPIWFQAIKNVSAVDSGIRLLPFLLAAVVGSIGAGAIVSRVGYCNPFFILSTIMAPTGVGLISTFTPNTGHAEWIGYQVLAGLGFGLGIQQPMLVVQTILDRSDIATGTAIIMFFRFLGPSILLPVAQNIFLNKLVAQLTSQPGIDPGSVTGAGATNLRALASGDKLDALLSDYNDALVDVFYMVAATCAVSVFGALLVEWRSVKAKAVKPETEGTGMTSDTKQSA
ncbi:MDR family MFS transporter [Aspergillus puulaauensis]|uniref:Major facilitator superfamily (MFS) profile domain-containing protein n=1 Tax=Aspergillus puulaauensis TaxID=1220207 RepID=A0A7R7XT19_9EURO|nr:uncharacterized protein APUU_60022S [Aspergillus puulaauensis]BCS26974.1 hypothetical protein APUU_60022S [Aspergillus puulaauensis]